MAQAQALAGIIGNTFTTAVFYNPSTYQSGEGDGKYVVVRQAHANNVIREVNARAIVDANTGVSSTVYGGGSYDQTVLASNGGLTFYASTGNVTVVAGGGNNLIHLNNDTDNTAVYLGVGDNTVFGGDGNSTIDAGGGDNTINLGGGSTLVDAYGFDTIHLGAGSETIDALSGSSVSIGGATHVSGTGFTLTFIGDTKASTVSGGAGSYDIKAGAGGGYFHGGSAGDNLIVGGSGAVTIIGGGAGDTLKGGTGAGDSIVAGTGNETLYAGGSGTVFNLAVHDAINGSGAGTTITIDDFGGTDQLALGGAVEDAYALSTFHVLGSNGTFKLDDGTKVVVDGLTSLTHSDFKT